MRSWPAVIQALPWVLIAYPERCSRVSGDHSCLGCCLARPRAEHERPGTHQTVSVVARVRWSARARITAPEAGAIPILTESFRFTFPVPAPPKIPLGHYFLPRRLGVQSDAGDLRLLDHRVRIREDGPAITLFFLQTPVLHWLACACSLAALDSLLPACSRSKCIPPSSADDKLKRRPA